MKRGSVIQLFSGVVMAFMGSFLLVSGARGAGGDQFWEDRFDREYKDEEAFAVAALGGQVFVAGGGFSGNYSDDAFLVRAYDAKSGSLLWEDRFDKSGDDEAYAIAAQGGQVLAAGRGGGNFLVRAYSGKSGKLLWMDQFDLAGGTDEASAVAVQGGRVYAAGRGRNASGNSDFLVRAYDAKSGKLFWMDRFDLAGGSDAATAIAVLEGQVVAVGYGVNAAGNYDFLVRAYNPKSGTLLWMDRFDTSGGSDWANAIAVQGGQVFAVGRGSGDFLVRAYSGKNGALLWMDQLGMVMNNDEAFAVAVQSGQVFVSGRGGGDFLVRAYNAKNGALLWMDQFDLAGSEDVARAIAVQGGQVFAAGWSWNDPIADPFFADNSDFLIRAYNAKNGALLWEDRFDMAGGIDMARAIAVQGGGVFAAGWSWDLAPNGRSFTPTVDFLIRAYRTR